MANTFTGVKVRSYPTFGAYLDTLKTPNPTPAENRSSENGRESFTGTASMSEALRLAESGWPSGCAKIDLIADEILEQVTSKIVRPEIVYDVVGVGFDMGRVVEDVPESWLTWQDGEEVANSERPVIRIVLNWSASGGISADVITMRGAATVALVKALEMAGRRVEVYAVHAINGYGPNQLLLTDICLKQAADPLQIDKLAFVLAHPSMLRRISFAVNEREPEAVREAFGFGNGGYGNPTEHPMAGDVVIGKALLGAAHWQSVAATREWVLATLKAQGVIIQTD